MGNLQFEVADYIRANSDKPIYVIYNELKNKKKLSKAECLVYIFLKLNKKKLGIKWLKHILVYLVVVKVQF